MVGILYPSTLPLQGERSHTEPRRLPAGPGDRMFGIPVGQGMAEFVAAARAPGRANGPGRRAALRGRRSRRSRRASPPGRPRRASARLPPAEIRPSTRSSISPATTSSPVLGVSGPADERQPVFAGNVFGRRRHDAPRGPPEAYGSAKRWKPRPYVRFYLLRRHGVVADVLRAVESLRRALPPACGPGGRGERSGPRRDDEERCAGVS